MDKDDILVNIYFKVLFVRIQYIVYSRGSRFVRIYSIQYIVYSRGSRFVRIYSIQYIVYSRGSRFVHTYIQYCRDVD